MVDVRERHREIVPIEKPTAVASTKDYTVSTGAGSLPLIEFSTEKQDDPNENVGFGDSSVHCSCPHCERTVVTFIDYETSWVTYCLGFVVWFSLGWMAFWVLPLLWPAFKDVVHHCPRCLNVIARKSRISLPTFRSEVMTLKVGSCAVVLARKYVVILCGLVGVIVVVAILRSTVHISPGQATRETVPKGADSMLSWEDFLHECGPRTSLGHRTSSARNFEEHFRRRTFKWQGEVLMIREGFDVFFLHAKSVVMIRMDPPRYPRRDIPDIALLFSDDKNGLVAPLQKGDRVDLEATMTAHGHRGDPEVMSLWHIEKKAGQGELTENHISAGEAAKKLEEETAAELPDLSALNNINGMPHSDIHGMHTQDRDELHAKAFTPAPAPAKEEAAAATPAPAKEEAVAATPAPAKEEETAAPAVPEATKESPQVPVVADEAAALAARLAKLSVSEAEPSEVKVGAVTAELPAAAAAA